MDSDKVKLLRDDGTSVKVDLKALPETEHSFYCFSHVV